MSIFPRKYSPEIAAAAAVGTILLLAVAFPSFRLRSQLREQVLLREGQTLQAVVAMQYAIEASEMERLGLGSADVDDFSTILQTARLAGVVGVRVFSEDGGAQEVFPPQLTDGALSAADWARLRTQSPVVRMHARYALSDLLVDPDGHGTAELVEIVVLLPGKGAGHKAAQYWIAGAGIAAELARQDRGLIVQGTIVWAIGSGVAFVILGLASRRLRRANDELRRRSEDLARANQELALAAKVSAIGAVAAHLIHGLKNPLEGLRGLALDRSRVPENGIEHNTAWTDAAGMAGRLQAMVEDVTALLRDEATGVRFRVGPDELENMVLQRTGDVRQASGVALTWKCAGGLEFDNRLAALVSLILSNLVTNACEASRAGSEVGVEIRKDGDGVGFAVSDRGCGIPPELRGRLFLPVTSTKPRGSGIGLAVSRNLAQHVGASLELKETGPLGSVFILRIPLSDGVKFS